MQDCPFQSSFIRHPNRRPIRAGHTAPRVGFTLIELLVVIGIIVVLIGILLPVVHKIRIAAQTADTKNWISELGSAIEHYQQDFRAYPGPFGNNDISFSSFSGGAFTSVVNLPPSGSGFDSTTALDSHKITMSENLVLGLLGGLHIHSTSPAQLDFDPSMVGGGPNSLSTILPKRYPPYLDTKQLSWRTGPNGKTGQYQDDAGTANDTIIPEFVDRYSDAIPILYLRAKVGANPSAGTGAFTAMFNPIITNDPNEAATDNASPANPAPRAGQYDLSQIIGYTGTTIGVGKTIDRSAYVDDSGSPIPASFPQQGLQSVQPNYPFSGSQQFSKKFPYDALPFLVGSAGQVKQKDGYILISAGPDRVYGTSDDICNFGTVGQ